MMAKILTMMFHARRSVRVVQFIHEMVNLPDHPGALVLLLITEAVPQQVLILLLLLMGLFHMCLQLPGAAKFLAAFLTADKLNW